MGADDVECRVATDDDWPEIWPIMSAIVGRGDTYTYPPDIAERDARSSWMLEETDRAATYVATLDGAVVGTAQLKANLPGLGDHVANAAWMVDPTAAGRGVGRDLAEYVLGEARRLGFRAMQFNAVVETNTRAIALWQSLGFTIVGTVPGAFRHVDAGDVAVHIMHRDLEDLARYS